jgi:deoxyribonuclease V
VSHAATVGAVDVHYDDQAHAKAALVVCRGITFSAIVSEHVADIARTEPYEPGKLYKRELPCIRAVLALGPRLELLVVDGHATLDPKAAQVSGRTQQTRSAFPSSASPRRPSEPQHTRPR